MIAVITGDIVNSKQGDSHKWSTALKGCLSKFGEQPKDWDIFRGDSFQLAIPSDKAFIASIYIKASLKALKFYDVHMAIGIGEQSSLSNMVKEANGQAFYRSGEAFETLKKQRLLIKTSNTDSDKRLNLMFKLALLTANQWSPVVAKTIKLVIENNDKSQYEIAQLMCKSQSVISETLKRGGYEEIMDLNNYYQQQISTL